MPASARFPVAVHVVTLLAHEGGGPLTSDYIAGSVDTNPVVIRRILGLLNKAGLVTSTEGAGGGTVLAKRADQITLGDVYRAVEPGNRFGATRAEANPFCPVGRSVQTVLKNHIARFEKALEKEMDNVSVANVLAGIRRPARR